MKTTCFPSGLKLGDVVSNPVRPANGLGTESSHAELEGDRDLELAAADEAIFEHLAECLVRELARRANRVDLAGFLDRAQPLDGPGQGN